MTNRHVDSPLVRAMRNSGYGNSASSRTTFVPGWVYDTQLDDFRLADYDDVYRMDEICQAYGAIAEAWKSGDHKQVMHEIERQQRRLFPDKYK